jgi:hypothetical protein
MIPAGDGTVEHPRLAVEGPAGAGSGSDEDTATARGMKARRGQQRPERARARRAGARASEATDRGRLMTSISHILLHRFLKLHFLDREKSKHKF